MIIRPLHYCKVREVRSPERGTGLSAGIDFYVPYDFKSRYLLTNQSVNIPSGIKIDFVKSCLTDHCLYFCNKSGVAAGMNLLVGACLVDADYQGEIHLDVHNVGGSPVDIIPGMKLTQALLMPISYADMIETDESVMFDTATERGDGGFGSTGN
jgi:deoxyuridine 5'-triphosphate nucleotidohydrolase